MRNRILMMSLMTVVFSALAAGEPIVNEKCPKGDCTRKAKVDELAKPASQSSTGRVSAQTVNATGANMPKVDTGRVHTDGSPCLPNEDCVAPVGPKSLARSQVDLTATQKIPAVKVKPQLQLQQQPLPGNLPPPR